MEVKVINDYFFFKSLVCSEKGREEMGNIHTHICYHRGHLRALIFAEKNRILLERYNFWRGMSITFSSEI